MNNGWLKKALPHLIAVAIFLIVAVVFCKPALQGKVLQQSDTHGWKGMAQQSIEFEKKYGHLPLWTNSTFGGMPAYQIAMDPQLPVKIDNIAHSILTVGLPQPMNFFLLACICFYLLCIVAGINPWLAVIFSIAYSFSTYDPIIIATGHITKMISIAYTPGVVAGILLLYNRKYIMGFALTALFSTQLVVYNHLQTVYYVLLLAIFFTIAYLVYQYKIGEIKKAFTPVLLAILAGSIGIAACAVNLLPTYEMSKETMRGGKSELTLGQKDGNKTKGGLDKDYAFRWSYGKMETFTFIIPSLYGGSNGGREFSESSRFAEKLSELGVPAESALQNANGSAYWGEQPFTSGPVYLGAIICFLFVFGLVYVKSWHKWWIAGITIFAIILAWGKNFEALNYFLFDHLPFYNKFRAPSTSLIIPQLTFPFLAALALQQLIHENDFSFAAKKLKLAGIITGGIMALMVMFYFSADFSSTNDQKIKENFTQGLLQQSAQGQQPSQQQVQQVNETVSGIMKSLRDDRQNIMGKDLVRNIFLIALAFTTVYLYTQKKLGLNILLVTLFVLVSFDLLGIANRYLSSDNYIDKQEEQSEFPITEADQQILKDTDHNNFRVFNQTVQSPFEESGTSYYHNSIGGYLPVRLALYNDLMDHQLYKGNMRVYNMLNTKYFITQDAATNKPVAQLNPAAQGNAWPVKNIKWVDNADQEMLALDSTDLSSIAIIDNRYKALVQQYAYDSTATIKLAENLNDKLVYNFSANNAQLIVFSEIYYDKGWYAFIDGKQTPYLRANYALRALSVPAGKHTIEFTFKPASYTTGKTLSLIGHCVVLLSVLAAIAFAFIKRKLVTK
jgi:Bacterial membrane protein YfhO